MKIIDKKIKYQVKPEDLEKCFEFSIKYHLNVGGGSYNRTTGQYRGLGEKIDSFCVGKIIEVGVASIIEKFTDKKMLLDFDIHGPTDEPDIIRIKENNKKRMPRMYIEIKNISPSDRWVGLTEEQFGTILNSEIVEGDGKKASVIYAFLFSKNSKKDNDLLGVYLKARTGDNLFKNFCDLEDLEISLQHIVSLKELKEKGVKFKEGSYMYETEIFKLATKQARNQIMNPKYKNLYKSIKTSGGVLPIVMRDNYPKPKEFGKFRYKGNLNVFVKYNKKSKRMYVQCESDVVVKNEVLGIFELEKGKIYECFFETLGRSPVLKRNNIWIAHRNLSNILSQDLKERTKKIAEEI